MAPGGNDTLDPAPGSDRSGAHRSEAKDNHPQPLSTPAPRRGRRNVIIGVLVVVVIALAALLLLLMSKASKAKGTPQPSTDVISSRTSPSFSSPSTSSYPSFTPSSPFPPRPTPPGPTPPWTTPFRPTPPWTTPFRPTPPWTTPFRPTPPWTTPFRPTPPKWTTPYKVTPSPPQCDTEACQRVADELNPGQYGGSPCENFYSYVCGERNHKHKQAYEAELFGKLVDDVAEGIRAQTWIPGTGQTATQKAAKAYQACENIVAENRTNMDTVKRILREAGFFSPNEWRDSLGILNASFFLAATWRIASPFRIEYMQHTGLGFTLRIGLSQSAVAYVKERGKPDWNARSRNDFDTMEATFQAPGEPKISYDDWKRVDDSVTTEWRNILDFRPRQTMFQGWNETTVYDSIHEINRTDWDFLLRKYFNSTGARRLYLGSPQLLMNFAGIPTRLGAKKARAFYRWYMVEVLACVVYAPWVTRRHGDREDALKLQRRFCFAIMEKSAGYAFLAPFIKKKFTAQVKGNIAGILSQVHNAYEKDLFAGSAVFPVSIGKLLAYDYSGGQVFRLLNVSDDSTLDKHYAKYEDMTDDPLVNWKRLRTGLTQSSYGDVTMTSAGAVIKSVRFFTIDPYRLDFALRPDLAVLPFFDSSLPPVLKLAGLGPILASAIIETLRAGKIGWSQRESVAWNEARDCIRGRGTQPWASNRPDLLEGTVALAAVASALKKTPDSPRALKDVAGLSNPLQVLFTAWCHLKCGGDYGQELCNEPLKELNAFFDAFQCGGRDGMRKQSEKCTAGWFQV
ncbi:uncharacterized protein LOC144179685 [Haemaphysalis longicornis]